MFNISKIYDIFKNDSSNMADIEFFSNWFSRMISNRKTNLKEIIYESTNPFETFLELEMHIFVDDFSKIFSHYVVSGDLIICEYMLKNYPKKIIFKESFLKFMGYKKSVDIFDYRITDIRILEIFLKYAPKILYINLDRIFSHNFFLGNCDVVNYMLINFRLSYSFNSYIKRIILQEKDIDCINLIFKHQIEFFDTCEDHVIRCDKKIAELFIAVGFGKKLDLLYLCDYPELLKEYKEYLFIEQFFSNSRKFYRQDDCIDFLKIISYFPDFLDHKNVIKKKCKCQSHMVVYKSSYENYINLINSNRNKI